MFGNKVLDFNYDSSAFKSLQMLIKGEGRGQRLLELTNAGSNGNAKYRLVIFYLVSSERQMFEVHYDA